VEVTLSTKKNARELLGLQHTKRKKAAKKMPVTEILENRKGRQRTLRRPPEKGRAQERGGSPRLVHQYTPNERVEDPGNIRDVKNVCGCILPE